MYDVPDWVPGLGGVASHADAWIEINTNVAMMGETLSYPTRMRGLKFFYMMDRRKLQASHPTQMRGLKSQEQISVIHGTIQSHPTRMRGLKSV